MLNFYNISLVLTCCFLVIFISCSSEDDPIPKVSANFEASTTILKEGEIIKFTDLSTGETSSWNWTFEGGNPSTSNVQNPEIVYSTYGNFNVRLIVSNSNSLDSIVKDNYIEVQELEIANFGMNQTIIKVGDTIMFEDRSTGNPSSWYWTFEGGAPKTSTDQNPRITYYLPGKYSVSLSVSNNDTSYSVTKPDAIEVNMPSEFDMVGTWERAFGNSTQLIGIQISVDVSETEGIITDQGNWTEWLPLETVKWRNIQKLSSYTYSLEDRSSQPDVYEYFDGDIVYILSDGNGLVIGSFERTHLGTYQRWDRKVFKYPEQKENQLTGIWTIKKVHLEEYYFNGLKVLISEDGQTAEVIESNQEHFPVGSLMWSEITKLNNSTFRAKGAGVEGETFENTEINFTVNESEIIVGSPSKSRGAYQLWERN